MARGINARTAPYLLCTIMYERCLTRMAISPSRRRHPSASRIGWCHGSVHMRACAVPQPSLCLSSGALHQSTTAAQRSVSSGPENATNPGTPNTSRVQMGTRLEQTRPEQLLQPFLPVFDVDVSILL